LSEQGPVAHVHSKCEAKTDGDIRAALLSDEELATGTRLDVGRKLFGGLPERIWIHDIK
jgi:hypothetical protein